MSVTAPPAAPMAPKLPRLPTAEAAYHHSNDTSSALHNTCLLLKGLDIILAWMIEDIPHGRIKEQVEIAWAMVENCYQSLEKIEVYQDEITQFLSTAKKEKESFGGQ